MFTLLPLYLNNSIKLVVTVFVFFFHVFFTLSLLAVSLLFLSRYGSRRSCTLLYDIFITFSNRVSRVTWNLQINYRVRIFSRRRVGVYLRRDLRVSAGKILVLQVTP